MSLAKAKNEIKAAGDTINAELHTQADRRVVEATPYTIRGDQKTMLLGKALRHLNRAFECLVEAEKID